MVDTTHIGFELKGPTCADWLRIESCTEKIEGIRFLVGEDYVLWKNSTIHVQYIIVYEHYSWHHYIVSFLENTVNPFAPHKSMYDIYYNTFNGLWQGLTDSL